MGRSDDNKPTMPAAPTCQGCPVRRLAVFKPFTPEQVDTISRLRKSFRVLPRKTRVLKSGQSKDEFYTLFSGWAFRYKMLESGRRQIMDFLLPGDFIGFDQLTVVDSGMSVEALTDVAICVFDRTQMIETLKTHPTLAMSVAWMTSQADTVMAEHLTGLGRKSAVDRVGSLLLELFTRQARREHIVNSSCRFPLTRHHIADAVGLSDEYVTRALRELRDRGFVTLEAQRLAILNYEELARSVSWTDTYLVPRAMF